jgi:hypothetical protein
VTAQDGLFTVEGATDTIGLFDPATSRFYLRNSNTTGVADIAVSFGPGGSGWPPLTGDWDGA